MTTPGRPPAPRRRGYWTFAKTHKAAGVHPNTVYRAIEREELAAEKIDGCWYIPTPAARAYAAQKRKTA